jgi:L-threonylcarbamoyladenylate synthase
VDAEILARAVEILRAGGLVAFPTETVYGLAADAASEAAVRRLLDAKGRPAGRALPVLLPPEAEFGAWGAWSEQAGALAGRFWPGPLTLVVPRSERVPDLVVAGAPTVGLRVPDHPVALALLRAFGGGLATPSANRSDRLSPTTAEHVRAELGSAVDLVLDGGPCRLGVESTVVSLAEDPPRILRSGALPRAALEEVLGREVLAPGEACRRLTGAPMYLVPESSLEAAMAGSARVGVLSRVRPRGATAWRETTPDPATYARDLYRLLREIDGPGFDLLLVAEPPADPAWEAVKARLRRMASV